MSEISEMLKKEILGYIVAKRENIECIHCVCVKGLFVCVFMYFCHQDEKKNHPCYIVKKGRRRHLHAALSDAALMYLRLQICSLELLNLSWSFLIGVVGILSPCNTVPS